MFKKKLTSCRKSRYNLLRIRLACIEVYKFNPTSNQSISTPSEHAMGSFHKAFEQWFQGFKRSKANIVRDGLSSCMCLIQMGQIIQISLC
jgi:hypothetical protein